MPFFFYNIYMKIFIKDDSIKIGQLLKKISVISSGGQAKWFLENNIVKINGEIIRARGTKVLVGDTIWINDDLHQIFKEK